MRQGNYPLGTYFTLYCCATQSQRLNSIPETNVSVARRSQSLFQWFILSTTGRLYVLRVQVPVHYYDVIMGAMASQITNLTMVYSTVHSGPDQRKHQSSASLAFVTGEFPAKIASRRKMFPLFPCLCMYIIELDHHCACRGPNMSQCYRSWIGHVS